jgi:hypothetical protein
MTYSDIKRICNPYGLTCFADKAQMDWGTPNLYDAYYTRESSGRTDMVYAFPIYTGTTEEELEKIALDWYLQEVFL